MRKTLLIFVAQIVLCAGAFAQNVRFGPYELPSVSNLYPPLLQANLGPNSPVLSVCHSPANNGAAHACTNYATTYTGAGVACPNGAQDTPDPGAGTSACQVTGDAQGNLAWWAPPGQYDFTACVGTTCFGPYTVTAGLSVTSASRLSCQTGLGDGLNAIPSGSYLQYFCVNDSSSTQTISAIHCFTDNAGASTLAATNNAGTALLTAPITCNNTKMGGGAAGTLSAAASLLAGDAISFTFAADGTSKQVTFTVTMQQSP